ncbi:hypothetical protein GQX73_g9964 [Xylaria multiplex]|uniref:Major facilitator superfamily (MFS) profile domain-containing protein n=1 Tax=Xylaria multiplex TaxID=323545 RepID=A0A7C8IK55_9PEZI|nr:hypothetical protein GQX73_g9964 [Xylaria multiplex]
MAFEQAMFRNSVWSHDNRDITLHNFRELETPWNNAPSRRTPHALDPVSKFSSDSDDSYEDDYDDGRAFQGLGAAFTLPTGLALLRATRPIGIRKTIIFTLYATMSPIGLMTGAFGASLIVKVAWWPWVYWAFSITLFVLGIISNVTIPLALRAHKLLPGARAVILELDIPGMITGSTSLGLFGFAWCQAQAVGWQEAYLLIILIMSGILAALFALKWEVFWILVTIGCGWSCFSIWMFYGWQFVERLRSTPPLLTTGYFAPLLAVGCLAAITTRFVLYRIGLHALFCVTMLSIMAGGAIISTMGIRQTYWQQLFISVLFMTWGVYTSVPVATLMILKTVNKKHGGIAASLVCTVAYYGMGLGLGVAGTVERNVGSILDECWFGDVRFRGLPGPGVGVVVEEERQEKTKPWLRL